MIDRGDTDEETTVDAEKVINSFSEWRQNVEGWGWRYPDVAILWTRLVNYYN